MLNRYKVWDELNNEQEFAKDILAFSPNEAAIMFAELDVSGHDDKLYINCSQPICVLDVNNDKIIKFEVKGELVLQFFASEKIE